MHFVGSEKDIYMKFSVDKNDLLTFLRSKPFATDLPENKILPNNYESNFFLKDYCALPFGWNPDVLMNCWGTKWNGDDTEWGKIFVDMTVSKKAVIYLSVTYFPVI